MTHFSTLRIPEPSFPCAKIPPPLAILRPEVHKYSSHLMLMLLQYSG